MCKRYPIKIEFNFWNSIYGFLTMMNMKGNIGTTPRKGEILLGGGGWGVKDQPPKMTLC